MKTDATGYGELQRDRDRRNEKKKKRIFKNPHPHKANPILLYDTQFLCRQYNQIDA